MNACRIVKVALSLSVVGCSLEVEPDPLSILENGRWVDLTHDLSDEALFWPTAEPFQLDTVFAGYAEGGYYYEAFSFRADEHGGTHLDAPIHFAEAGWRSHEIPLESLTGPAAVVDVSESAMVDRDYQVTMEDIENWEARHGTSVDGHILLLRTGYHEFWPDAEAYMGTALRGEEGVAELSFPGIHPATAEWLAGHRDVKAVGLDTPSLDYGRSTLFRTHRILFEQNIPGFENVANLNALPEAGAYVVALPTRIRGGSGGPLRIAAWLPE